MRDNHLRYSRSRALNAPAMKCNGSTSNQVKGRRRPTRTSIIQKGMKDCGLPMTSHLSQMNGRKGFMLPTSIDWKWLQKVSKKNKTC